MVGGGWLIVCGCWLLVVWLFGCLVGCLVVCFVVCLVVSLFGCWLVVVGVVVG